MQILKRGNLVYYIKTESIIVGINDFQYIAYTVYPLQNRTPFYEFKKELQHSQPDQFDTIIKQISLAQKYGLKAVASRKPKQEEINEDSIIG